MFKKFVPRLPQALLSPIDILDSCACVTNINLRCMMPVNSTIRLSVIDHDRRSPSPYTNQNLMGPEETRLWASIIPGDTRVHHLPVCCEWVTGTASQSLPTLT